MNKKCLAIGLLLAGSAILPATSDAGVDLQLNLGGPPVELQAPPPPPQQEFIPPPPPQPACPVYVWAPGYWNWNGSGYVWTGGSYVLQQPGQHWVPAHYEPRHHHYVLVPGHWE